MGMPIEGFEEDFLEVMIKVAKRRNKGKNKGVVVLTKNCQGIKEVGMEDQGKREPKLGSSR